MVLRECGHNGRQPSENRAGRRSAHGAGSSAVPGLRARSSRHDRLRQTPVLPAELHPTATPGSTESTWRTVRPQGLVAVRRCGHEWKTAVSTRTAGELAARFAGSGAVPGRRARWIRHDRLRSNTRSRCPTTPVSEPGNRPAQLGARSGLKLWWRCDTCGHEWRTAVSTRTDGSGCPACYRASRRRAVANADRFGTVGESPASSFRHPMRAEFSSAAHVRRIRSMRTTQEIVQSIDERLRELNDEIKMLDAARVALDGHENRPSTRPPASVTNRRKAPARASSQTKPSARTRREISAEVAAESARRPRKRARTTSRGPERGALQPIPDDLVESLLTENGGLSTSALAEKTGANRDHVLAGS